MVEIKHMITYQEATDRCVGQKNAFPCTLTQGPTSRPSPETPSLIVCKAEVAFDFGEDLGDEVAGTTSKVSAECIMSPNPECKRCKVARLERRTEGKAIFVSKKEYQERGASVLLAKAGINMKAAIRDE